jgi:hypothetical protein
VCAELADEEVDGRHGLDLAVLLVVGPSTQILGEGRLQLVQSATGNELDVGSQLALRFSQGEQGVKFLLAVGHHQAALGLELNPLSSVSRLSRQLAPQFHPPQGEGQVRAGHLVGHEHVALAGRRGARGRAQAIEEADVQSGSRQPVRDGSPDDARTDYQHLDAGRQGLWTRAQDATTRAAAHDSRPGTGQVSRPKRNPAGKGSSGSRR